MMPSFGTIIPDLIFDPLDDETIQLVHDEVLSVLEFDPRVEVIEFSVTPDYDNYAITTDARLRYIELNIIDDFSLNIVFEQG